VRRALTGGIVDRNAVRHERIEEPTAKWVFLLLLELGADCAYLFAQLDSEPDRIIPQDLAGPAFHHLRADAE
jgi:hypothetical protein